MGIISETIPRHLLFGVVLFSLVIVGGISIISKFAEDDSSIIANSKYGQFNKSFNQMQQLESSVQDIQDSIQVVSEDYGLFGVLNALIAGSWQTVRTLFTSLGFMGTIFTGTAVIFGVPLWITGLLALMVTIVLAFAIWSAIFQKEL